jgi:VCBS repeat-containing protein
MATNNVPVANNDTYTTPFKTALVVPAAGVLTNDNDADGNVLHTILVTNVTNGTLVFNSDGSFTYTPTGAFSGTDSFTYRASDGISNSATAATVNITVNANTPPVAVADAYNTPPNTTLTEPAPGVLANDTDAEGSALTAVLVTAPPAADGTLTLNAATGAFVFTPQAAFTGTTTFTYHANDGTSNSADVTVTINVGTNNAPVAVADTYTTAEDTPLVVPATGVLGNDSDPDGNAITAVLATPPSAAQGTVTLNADGSFTFTPAANFNGTATFTYHARDISMNSADVTVTITVTPVNDPPVAVDDAYGTGFNTPRTVAAPGVLGNDTDIDGNPLTAFLVIPPFSGGTAILNADGSFTYIPALNFFGTDIFLYEVTDGADFSNIAAVYINVGINTPPVATDDAYTVPINTPLTVSAPGTLLNDTDADGNSLTASLAAPPAQGTLTFNADGSFTYTAPNGFTGAVTFTYMASDGIANSNTATVTINVGINSPPTANNDTYATVVNKTLTVTAPGVLGNDNDLDGNPITAVLATGPTNGTLTLNADGSFTYAPNTGFKGTDTFTYNANDGTVDSATTATVTIAVGVAPRKPVAVQLPAPPPATRCTDTNFENPGMIRSHFTNDIDRDQLYCRLIAAGGNYMYWYGSPITNAGNVGAQNVLDLGLVAAVDVFSMKDATGFVGDVDICLKGTGYIIYMNVSGAPRVPQLWSAWTTDAFPGYTCTTLYAPGTVILVSNKPQ